MSERKVPPLSLDTTGLAGGLNKDVDVNDRLFSFRWDVDHRACMTDGVPKIRSLCREMGVRNTFFVNMGRSTNLREWLGKGISKTRGKLTDVEAVHLIQKIGWPRFILETVLSRPVGRSFLPELGQLQSDGHELGQHGGSDHVLWSRRFAELPDDVLENDITDTHELHSKYFNKPAGFTSPGFHSDDRVMRIVDKLGFAYNGDAIGGPPVRATAGGMELAHWTIPVTICGPRTIPFLEWHGARSSPTEMVLHELDAFLEKGGIVVLYGHPCYEGVRIDLLRSVFERVLERGYRFVTHESICELLNANRLSQP